MDKRTEQKLNALDRTVDQAVQAIVARINKTIAKDEQAAASSYVVEGLFLKLAGELALTLDKISQPGPATLRLSNALADFRDARFEER